MKCDIFIRSYWKDFPWLELCLQAVHHFCRGFNEVILVVPRSSEPWLKRYPELTDQVRLEFDTDYSDDYLGQQVCKLYADQLSEADFICHIDSDCMVWKPMCPEDLVPSGLPKVYTRRIEELPRHWPWIQPTEDFLETLVTHDFMQQPPFTYPRWLYPKIHQWSESVKGVSLADWVLSRPARGFSEFNVLAAYSHLHHREQFLWINSGDLGEQESLCKWYWSWQGLDKVTRAQICQQLALQPSTAAVSARYTADR